MAKRAGILIIGNEILSGKTHDTNSHYLNCELRSLGVEVQEVLVIPDDVDIIAKCAVEFSSRFDLVFTSGGVGPTHDDVTIEGIAKGFGVKLTYSQQLIDILKTWYKEEFNEHRLKMAYIPEGAELLTNNALLFPLIIFRNIYIFPGIPEVLQEKFKAVRENFREAPYYLTSVYLSVGECNIVGHLNNLVTSYPELLVGSYPVLNNSSYKVKVTLESKDADYLHKATKDLLADIPAKVVVEVIPG